MPLPPQNNLDKTHIMSKFAPLDFDHSLQRTNTIFHVTLKFRKAPPSSTPPSSHVPTPLPLPSNPKDCSLITMHVISLGKCYSASSSLADGKHQY